MPYAGQLDADDRKGRPKRGGGGAAHPAVLALSLMACLGGAWLFLSGDSADPLGPPTGPSLPVVEAQVDEARKAGFEFSGVRFGTQEWLGGVSSRGMTATKHLEKDEVFATIPWECVLSDQDARKRSSWAKDALALDGKRPHANKTMQGKSHLGPKEIIGFALFEIFATGKLSLEQGPCDSFLTSYAQFMRKAIITDRQFPQHWDPVKERAPLALLEGTVLGSSWGRLEKFKNETAQNFQLLEETIGAEELARHGATAEVYGHARLAAASRLLPVKIPERPGQRRGRGYTPPAPTQAFIPLADLINFDAPTPEKPTMNRRDTYDHSGNFAPVEFWKNLDGDKIQMKLTKAVPANKALFHNYQPKASWEMLMLYGFTLPWVSNMTCFSIAPFHLSADGLPDLVLEPTRCTRESAELDRTLHAIRWRHFQETGLDEMPKAMRCSDLRPSVPVLTGEAWKSWKGCRQAQTVAGEIRAWQALGDMAIAGAERHEATIGDSAEEAWASTSSWGRAAHVLLDELTVYRSIARQVDAVLLTCTPHSERQPSDFAGLDRCIRKAREMQEKLEFNLLDPEGEL